MKSRLYNQALKSAGIETIDVADAVLLGCTELPLMIRKEDLELPLLNSTKIHIDAIFRAATV